MSSIFGEKVITPDKMREAEQAVMSGGVSEDELINRAATALADFVSVRAKKTDEILIAAGIGNNGADGLELAAVLAERGYSVSVITVGQNRNVGVNKRIENLREKNIRFVTEIEHGFYAFVIDCLFGIGLNRAPEDEFAKTIAAINASGAIIVSADVPSGLDAATGKAFNPSVSADFTVTFSAVKTGLILGEGRNFCGEISVANIGIEHNCGGKILCDDDARLPHRKNVSHKGTYGKVRIIGGSDVMPGAPLMCFESAVAASRCGAGLVTLCVPSSEKAAYQSRVKETMLCFLPDENGKLKFDENALAAAVEGADAVAVGCGMGRGKYAEDIVRYLLNIYKGTLILDADALNAVSSDVDMLLCHAGKLILTPHVVEFARLNKNSGGDYVEDIKNFAKRYDCVIAVKSATTVISDGKEIFYNVTGSPALSKGGSGDVLAGMVAAFACVLPPLAAVKAACYHFGLAGERAAKRLGSVTSVLASDVIIEIGYAD